MILFPMGTARLLDQIVALVFFEADRVFVH